MKPGTAARVAATVATGTYTLALRLAGVKLGAGVKSLVSYTPTFVIALFLVLDRWAWRWPVVHRLTGHPYLAGTWRLVLKPSADSCIPEGGNRGPIDAFLIVKQTWFGVHLTQVSRESRSTSLGATFRRAEVADQHVLHYSYLNIPLQQHQPRSSQHFGACTFTMVGRRPLEIDGSYFTGRLTRGDIGAALLDRKSDVISYDSLIARHGNP